MMKTERKNELQLWAAKIRKTALETIQTAGSGHIGGSFSIADILAVLYFDQMNVDPQDPGKPDRDRLILSRALQPDDVCYAGASGIFPDRTSVHIP